MQRNRSYGSRESGFTLVEVALVVVIGGLMLALFGNSLTNMIKESKVRTTETRLSEISDALRRYSSYNNILPCPASRILPTDDVSYGLPPTTGCNSTAAIAGMARDDITPVAPLTSEGVRIGMVPTRILNLPDDYGYDAWGSRFIYAVTESMTNTSTYDAKNSAVVVNIAGTLTNVAFVVVSVGKDKEGGYNAAGAAGPACNAMGPQIDEENCDDDRTFTNALQSSAEDANYYDDYISFKNLDTALTDIPEGAIVAFRLSSCPKGWAALPDVEGRVIVGSGDLDTSISQPAGPANPPSTGTTAYTGTTYARPDPDGTDIPDTGGWASRADTATIASPVREYSNMPPYVAFLYCVKTGANYAYAMGTSSGTPSSGSPSSSGTPSSSSTSTTSSTSTSSTSTTSSTSSGKSSGGKKGRVICTYFNNRRRLSKALLEMEQEHTYLYISDVTKRGYHFWAIPLVRLLQQEKYPWLEEIVYKITMWRVAEISYQMGQSNKPNYLGKLVRLIGEPLCYLIGHFVPQQDWQSLETAYARKE